MSIQGVYRPYRPAVPVRAAMPGPAPVAPPAPVLQPAASRPVDLLESAKALAGKVGRWLLMPLRHYAGNYGADLFVRPGQHTAEGLPPSHYGLAYETLNFESKDGTPLKGWYIPAKAPTDKTIVLAHGHAGQKSDVLDQWGPWLHKAGYNVLCFDFRNSGGSGGNQTTMGFQERWDLDAAITQAQAKGGRNIAVMGLSMGGATALSQAKDDPRIKAVVADCSFDTLQNAVESRVRKVTFDLGPFKGLSIPLPGIVSEAVVEAAEKLTGHTESSLHGKLRDAEPLRAMKGLQDRPVFLIHGEKDDDTLPSNSVNLARAHPGAELWIVPGAPHAVSYYKARQAYQARVLDFLGRSL